MQRIQAHKIRIYPDSEQQLLLLRTFGCCRLLYNLALEQRSTFWQPGRRMNLASWSSELRALKEEAPFLRVAPHHCLLQALKDLEQAYSRFFKGQNSYPTLRRKFQNESCRFPDPKQFTVGKDSLTLPKLGRVVARIHRPIQGQLRSITVSRDGNHWYASVLVRVSVKAPAARPMAVGGFDVNVAQPIVESDGTVHMLPRVSARETERQRRLQRMVSRRKKGSKRRERARAALRSLKSRQARRRRNAAHQVSTALVRKYTHLAGEALRLKNMTASARGTVEKPGRNVRQKAGLNRAMLDVAPGQVRAMVAYKSEWCGTEFTTVEAYRTSQTCSSCSGHPADRPETAHLEHGRVTRDLFVCPLCGFTADADVNAACNIRDKAFPGLFAVSRQNSAAATSDIEADVMITAGPAVSDRGALCMPERASVTGGSKRASVRREQGDADFANPAKRREAVTKIYPQVANHAA
jgi:putative transposase